MPIYEYVCRDCKHEFEVLIRGKEQPVCPKCGKKKVDKQLSVPSAHTTGSGDTACPVQSQCPAPSCCGKSCGLGGMM